LVGDPAQDPTTAFGYQRFRSTGVDGDWVMDAGGRRFVEGRGVFLEPDPVVPGPVDPAPTLWLHSRGDPTHVVDPDGRCGVAGAAVGGAFGVVVGAGFSLVNGEAPINALAHGVLSGVGGMAVGATCGIGAGLSVRAVAGAFQGGVGAALRAGEQGLTLAELGRSAVVGGIGDGLGGLGGGALPGLRAWSVGGPRWVTDAAFDVGSDWLAQSAGAALGGPEASLAQSVSVAASGGALRAVHLGGTTAAEALRVRAETAVGEAAAIVRSAHLQAGRQSVASSLGNTLGALREFGLHRLADHLERNPRSWLAHVAPGIVFDRQRQRALGTSSTMHHEVYVECATCRSGYARLDTYDQRTREIISRKYAQLSAISERTAKRYIDELATRYRPGTMIADVPSSRLRALDGKELRGRMILEIPAQTKEVPREIIEYGLGREPQVIIRDIHGRVYE
jgi:hypothetical protein